MIRVGPTEVLAGEERRDTGLEIVEGGGEMPRVPARGLESEPRGPQHADPHERQHLETDEGHLPSQLVDGGITNARTEIP